ncbi:DsbA family oxidoreductase [Altererythrobacter salegens]|uniref:DsbA family oxidoreductase n=1 Tax=Croceibacterium salegens TaxID=1737568 RepID=A0A6I4STK1_9SPHN|nr:DsbA family oxidoreductase [Croceibacterium salegens]MXO58377.1 DsbA family oxidoreductase [Croceibacterium salegens]
MSDKPKVMVDIWSDVMCPWCAIGYAQFARAVKELDGEIEVEARWMPFELNPDMPPEGKSQADHIAKVHQRTPEQISEMQQGMEARGEAAGFPLSFTGDDGEPAMMWNTFEAHKLLRWALTAAGPEAQTRLKVALLEAHFQQHRHVGEREVLLDIAEEQGFDRQAAAAALDDEALAIATRMEERRGVEAGINSVPSFVFAGRYLVPGAQEPEVFAATIRKVAELVEAV